MTYPTYRLPSFPLLSQQASGKIPVANSMTSYIERHVVAEKLSTESSTPLGYTSLFLSSVISLPFLMQNIGVSPAWYLPITTLALSYLKSDKNRHDRKAAIQIVTDYEVPFCLYGCPFDPLLWLSRPLSFPWRRFHPGCITQMFKLSNG